MNLFIIIITASIFIAWPKITFCNLALLAITSGVASLLGENGGPVSFLIIYALFAIIALYDGLSKRQKEQDAKKDEAEQASWSKAMRDNKKKRSH